MAINANMHQEITWPSSNCGNKLHEIMACLPVFCVTEMHHTFGRHSAGSWSQEEPLVKIHELQSVLRVSLLPKLCAEISWQT